MRDNRRPLDTPLWLHTVLDDWFYKKFKVRARSNALFCSFNDHLARNYGNVYRVFPIGKYQAISSFKVKDLYFELIDAST